MIDNEIKLKLHLKLFKKKLEEENVNQLMMYPIFCEYLSKNTHKYKMDKYEILDKACEIFLD